MKILIVGDEFQVRFDDFMRGLAVKELAHAREHGYPESSFSADGGRRYIRIWRQSGFGGGRSAHCFIDKTNGDVLMCATFKAPAKHARGNIFKSDNGLDCMQPYGAAYLR